MATAGSITLDLLLRTGSFETDTRRAEKRLQEMQKTAVAAGRAIASGLAVAGTAAAAWAVGVANAGKEIERFATLSNASAESFQRWSYGARTVGLEQEKLADILKDTQDRVGDFLQTGGGPMADFFEKIAPQVGVTAEQFRKLSGPEALGLYVQSLERAGLSQSEMIFYMEAMASDSALLIPLLKDNAAAMSALGDEAQRAGAIMSNETVVASAELERNLDRLRVMFGGVSTQIANSVIPVLNSFVEYSIEATNETDDLHAAARALAGDDALPNWLGASLVGFARLVDVVIVLGRSLNVAVGAVKAASADSKAVIQGLIAMPTNPYTWFSDEPNKALEKTLAERNATVEKFNKDLDDLWNIPANKYEQSAIKAIEKANFGKNFVGPIREVAGIISTMPPIRVTPEDSGRALKTNTELIKSFQEFSDERGRFIDSQYDEIAAIDEKARHLEMENSVYGQSKTAIDALHIARLEEQAAMLAGFDGAEQQVALINKEIEARKRLMQASSQRETLEAADRAADVAAQAQARAAEESVRSWENMTDQVGQSLTDALMDGGRSAKDMLQDLFRTMVLRPMLQPVVQGGMNAIGSALGIDGAPNSGLSSGGGILGAANNLKTLYTGITGGLTSTLASGVGAIGNAIGSSAVSSFALGMQGNTLAAGLMGPTTAAAGGAMGAGAMLASAMPWVAGGLAVASLVSSMFNEAEARYGGTYTYRPGQGTERPGWAAGDAGPQAMQFADSLLRNASDAVQRAFAAAGSDALLTAFEASFESSEKGRGGTHSGGTIVIDGHEISFGTSRKGEGHGGRNGTLEEMMQAAEIDTYQSVIQGLQAGIGEFPRIARSMLEGVDADSLGLQDAQALIQAFVQSLEQIRALSNALASMPWVPATAATFDFAAALAEAAGGAENAANLVAGFYQGYYTEAERMADLTGQLTEQFAAMGLEVPRTREEMRALVQANMALGEGGAQTAAKLLGLGDSLLTLIDYTDRAAEAAAQAAQAQRQAAEKALEDAQRAAYEAAIAARRAAEQSATDAVSILANAVNARKSELQKAFDQVAEGLNKAISASQTTLQNLESLASSLRSTLRTMAGQFDQAMNRATAQAQIASALSAAQRGVMPSADSLQNALQVVTQPSAGLFSSFEDYQLDFMRTANDIAALNDLTGVQISTEEKTLQALRDQLEAETERFEEQMAVLDALLENAQSLLEETLGTKLAVMSVEDAIIALGASIDKLKATPAPSEGSQGGYINGIYQSLFGRNAEQSGIDYWTDRVAGGLPISQVEQAIREAARNEDRTKLRGFDIGTGYVPYDMPANIHKGEIIIDPRSSDILRRYGIGVQPQGRGGRTDLLLESVVAEQRDMKEVLRSHLYPIAKTNDKIAKLLDRWDMDGQPEVREVAIA